MPDKPDYIGFYINLDRSAYSRFAADDGHSMAGPAGKLMPGALGCFASHAGALRRAIGAGTHVHVLADDALLSPELAPALKGILAQGDFDYFA